MEEEREASPGARSIDCPQIRMCREIELQERAEQSGTGAECECQAHEPKRAERIRVIFPHAPDLGIASYLQKFRVTFCS